MWFKVLTETSQPLEVVKGNNLFRLKGFLTIGQDMNKGIRYQKQGLDKMTHWFRLTSYLNLSNNYCIFFHLRIVALTCTRFR